MRHRFAISGSLAVLLIGMALVADVDPLAAQTKEGGAKPGAAKDAGAKDAGPKDGSAKEGAAKDDPAAPARPGASRAKPIEIEQCTIKPLDEVTLSFDRPGVIAFVKPREGDSVAEGQLIAGLQDEVAQAALAVAAKEAESDVDIRYAEKAGALAEIEHRKALEANRTVQAIPEVEVLRLKLAAEKTVLELESAKLRRSVNELKRDEAQVQLETYRVKAPFTGVVTRVHRSKGEAVRQGDQVLELVNTKSVRVEGVVRIRDVWQVKPGCEVQVKLDLPGIDHEVEKQSFPGRIVFVSVKAEPVSQTVRVWAEVDNPENVLRGGLLARMTIFPDRVPPKGEGK
jgi:RND family efflux transporter MFP subunit